MQTERVFRAARALNLPVKLHAEQLSDQHGAALAARYAALSADHLEWLGAEGSRRWRQPAPSPSCCPAPSTTCAKRGVPPIQALRDANVPIAVSTDCNPGSSPVMSLLTTMNMACTLFRLTPQEAVMGVTLQAARALGLADTLGSLEVGKIADFALFDIERPADLAYAVGWNPCVAVVNGGVQRPPRS